MPETEEKLPSPTPPAPKVKWTITLGGGEWATIKYGVVEYLRQRPKMRTLTAAVGILWVLGWLATSAGYKWHSLVFPSISTFFVTPTLLWLAVVSGPDFQLAFGPAKTAEPAVVVPPALKGLLDVDTYGIEALNKSYASTESYARSSFRWSILSLVAGIGVGSANVWLANMRPDLAVREHTGMFIWVAVSTFLGLCSIFLVRSMFLFRRASRIHDRLLELRRALTVIKLIEGNSVVAATLDAGAIISRLLEPGVDSHLIQKESDS
ncbi:hypothetical protein [Tunturibacter empetritectus]|uniref:Uncharacterized protein n=1 Tax=Tunturiibacter lichenicola TaxID=2051959 RepID=A0A7W8N4V4_9BACT|nr:hypothetical protein [Edaphobacter lichenicola]MBB5343921.1 hypothetical protein [Edaphobacter lichenicola]